MDSAVYIGTDAGPPMALQRTWHDDGDTPANGACGDSLDLYILDQTGSSGPYQLGIVDSTGWTGEACTVGTGTFQICHDVGIKHTLNQVGDCLETSVEGGTSTLFDASLAPVLTYILIDGTTGNCYVSGYDTAYYGSMGCDLM